MSFQEAFLITLGVGCGIAVSFAILGLVLFIIQRLTGSYQQKLLDNAVERYMRSQVPP